MKLSLVTLLTVAALSVPVSSLSVFGGELGAALDELGAQIDGVGYKNQRDQAGLQRKLLEAIDKIDQGKDCDAVGKLMDISAKVVALRDASKPKIWDNPEDERYTVQALLDAADTAIHLLGGPCN